MSKEKTRLINEHKTRERDYHANFIGGAVSAGVGLVAVIGSLFLPDEYKSTTVTVLGSLMTVGGCLFGIYNIDRRTDTRLKLRVLDREE